MSSELTEEYKNEQEWWIEEGYANPDDVPVPDWHWAIINERLARYESEDVTKWTTLEEFEKEIEEFMQSLTSNKE